VAEPLTVAAAGQSAPAQAGSEAALALPPCVLDTVWLWLMLTAVGLPPFNCTLVDVLLTTTCVTFVPVVDTGLLLAAPCELAVVAPGVGPEVAAAAGAAPARAEPEVAAEEPSSCRMTVFDAWMLTGAALPPSTVTCAWLWLVTAFCAVRPFAPAPPVPAMVTLLPVGDGLFVLLDASGTPCAEALPVCPVAEPRSCTVAVFALVADTAPVPPPVPTCDVWPLASKDCACVPLEETSPLPAVMVLVLPAAGGSLCPVGVEEGATELAAALLVAVTV
jgi:hypothetical protein